MLLLVFGGTEWILTAFRLGLSEVYGNRLFKRDKKPNLLYYTLHAAEWLISSDPAGGRGRREDAGERTEGGWS